jgi:hypothetical protein
MPTVDEAVVVNSPPPSAIATTMPVAPVATPPSPTNANAPTLPTATRIATRAASRPIARRITHVRKPVLRGNVLRSLVLHNGTIIVNVRTAPRMRVRISVKLTHTTYFVAHRGRHRRRIARAVVLYATTVRTKANNTGCITESMRVAYTPPKPVRAVLMVMVHTKQRTAIRRKRVTLYPRRRERRRALITGAHTRTGTGY